MYRDHRKEITLIKPHAPSQTFIEIRIWPADLKAERKDFLLPLLLVSLGTLFVGAKKKNWNSTPKGRGAGWGMSVRRTLGW